MLFLFFSLLFFSFFFSFLFLQLVDWFIHLFIFERLFSGCRTLISDDYFSFKYNTNLGIFLFEFTTSAMPIPFSEAVYSDELTGVTDTSGKVEGGGYIQRLPYFILVRRVYDERHELTEELKEQLDIVKKRWHFLWLCSTPVLASRSIWFCISAFMLKKKLKTVHRNCIWCANPNNMYSC